MSRPASRFSQHLMVLQLTLLRLGRQPLSSLMTIGVIAITLALPTGLHLVLGSAQSLSRHWQGTSSISAFLKPEVKADEGAQLKQQIVAFEGVEQVQLLTQEEALTEFSLFSGFDEALGLLEENPLPMVLLIRPDPAMSNPERMEQLLARLRMEPTIEHVVLDLEWVRRLAAITETATRVVLLISLLLGLAVVLVIGNTIRLEIRNRQEEIILVKQVGGSDAFVRRPFLYTGLCYGLFGALGAWLLILLAAILLEGPITELASLYQSDYRLSLLNLETLSLLLIGGPLLGLLGAWSATGRLLGTLDP